MTSTWESRVESTFSDRAGWANGEWDGEPDRVEWRWRGPPRLACLIVRGPSGALCGYVGVPPGHPYHGQMSREMDVDVHGGVTYTEPCVEGGNICHVAQPGEADEVYWIGFDCAHSWDKRPREAAGLAEPYATYKSIGYVRNQVESLAAQLCRVAKGLPAREEGAEWLTS